MTCQWRCGTTLPSEARLTLSGRSTARCAASTAHTTCMRCVCSAGASSDISGTCACQITRQNPGYPGCITAITRQRSSCHNTASRSRRHNGQSVIARLLGPFEIVRHGHALHVAVAIELEFELPIAAHIELVAAARPKSHRESADRPGSAE